MIYVFNWNATIVLSSITLSQGSTNNWPGATDPIRILYRPYLSSIKDLTEWSCWRSLPHFCHWQSPSHHRHPPTSGERIPPLRKSTNGHQSTAMVTTFSYQHTPKNSTFIYVCHNAKGQFGYALGHEFLHTPHIKSFVALYAWGIKEPVFVGRFGHIVAHWQDCMDIVMHPSSFYYADHHQIPQSYLLCYDCFVCHLFLFFALPSRFLLTNTALCTASFLSQTGTAWSMRSISSLYKPATLQCTFLTLTYSILPWIYLVIDSLALEFSKSSFYFWVDAPLKPWTSSIRLDTQNPFGRPLGWISDSIESTFDLTQAKRNILRIPTDLIQLDVAHTVICKSRLLLDLQAHIEKLSYPFLPIFFYRTWIPGSSSIELIPLASYKVLISSFFVTIKHG